MLVIPRTRSTEILVTQTSCKPKMEGELEYIGCVEIGLVGIHLFFQAKGSEILQIARNNNLSGSEDEGLLTNEVTSITSENLSILYTLFY